ncbi:MAG: phenylalanine--tRNA ligase subunit beta, partial [Tissierellia bacterium]|nr:phenylalanine--tRNA ligase subunit beta [Tissierellia bacterium]
PINNIVDITNYVMLEFGQPLHAFDLDKLNSKKILVRRAEEGEKIKTIDDIERALKPSNLVIADENRPIAIAGVMGGFDTEVDENTTTVLLESANFNGKSVRLTAKELNLRTEASSRFEKGIDSNLCETAANRVCQLVEEIGAGTVVGGNIDVYKSLKKEKEIILKTEYVNRLLGIDLEPREMANYLERLELKTSLNGDKINVLIPSFRLDLKEEVDLIEEIGRLYGFHNIEPKPLVGVLTRGGKSYESIIEGKTNTILQGLGLNQVMTYSFISPRVYDKLNLKENNELRNYIKILNPLGEDYSVMRTTLIPNMLGLLSRNYNYGVEECFFYEIGNIFIPKELPVKELPLEKKILSVGMYGDIDFYTIKEVVENLFRKLGIMNIEFLPKEDDPIFHPYRTAEILYENEAIGIIGEIHIDIMENFEIEKKSYIGEIDFDKIVEITNLEKSYKPLPKYPSIARDIALVVNRDIMIGQLEKAIWENGGGLIEEVKLFDIYEGDQVGEGKKSVAFGIRYRSYERTLKDKEINEIQENIVKELEKSLGAQLRS